MSVDVKISLVRSAEPPFAKSRLKATTMLSVPMLLKFAPGPAEKRWKLAKLILISTFVPSLWSHVSTVASKWKEDWWSIIMIQTVKKFLYPVNIARMCSEERNILHISPFVPNGLSNVSLGVEILSKGKIRKVIFSIPAGSLCYPAVIAQMSWKGRTTKIIGTLIVVGIRSAANSTPVIPKSLEKKCPLMRKFVQNGQFIVKYLMVAMQSCFEKNSKPILVCLTWEVDVMICRSNLTI